MAQQSPAYLNYLASHAWQVQRRRRLEFDGYRCQRCGASENLDVHHLTYARLGYEDIADLFTRCRDCHTHHHQTRRKEVAAIDEERALKEMRQFQQDFYHVCKEMRDGLIHPRFVCLHVGPGGGKSSLPVIAAKLLIPSVVERLAWFTPRTTLRRQAAEGFDDQFWQQLLNHRFGIREVRNEVNPCGTKIGYVSSHQALSRDQYQLHAQEFSKSRYALFIDEGHHVYDGTALYSAIRPLVAKAAVIFILTGTLQRNDKRPISFVNYVGDARDLVVDRTSLEHYYFIEYDIEDALREKAIIPISFIQFDGPSRWLDRSGKEVESEAMTDDDDAIYTALNTEIGQQILRRCVEDWKKHRMNQTRSQLLVVCGTISQAKMYLRFARDARSVEAAIATTDNDAEADINIQRFKSGDIPIRITVGKAYEGMDAPSITHRCCLTHIRSQPWLFQMFGRLWRVDNKAIRDGVPYEEQTGYAYVPGDRLMCEVIKTIRDVRDRAIFGRVGTSTNGTGQGIPRDQIVPLSSSVATEWSTDIAGETISADEYARAQMVRESFNLRASHIDITRMLRAWDAGAIPPLHTSSHTQIFAPRPTSRKTEGLIRGKINSWIQTWCAENDREPEEINRILSKDYGPREQMKDPEQLMNFYLEVQRRLPRDSDEDNDLI